MRAVQIDGATYQIDLTQPSKFNRSGGVINEGSNLIVTFQFNGAPMDPSAKFVVAANNYRAGGDGNFRGTGGTIIFEGPDTNRDVIVRYTVDQGTTNPQVNVNWGFAPAADTSVIFETGPAGIGYNDGIEGVNIKATGDGFALLRL